jgi:hypothetical protein
MVTFDEDVPAPLRDPLAGGGSRVEGLVSPPNHSGET